MLLDAFPFIDEVLESAVHRDVLGCLMAHLLDIDFLEKGADVDALDQFHDSLLNDLVVDLELIVVLNQIGILLNEYLVLSSQTLPTCLQL